MSTLADSTDELNSEAYFLLERKLQPLRLKAMRLSADFARQQNRPVTRDDVDRALRSLAKTGLDLPTDQTEEPIGNFPQDTYMYLEKRLHNLRMIVVRWAAKFARRGVSPSEKKPQLLLSSENIESAWTILASEPSVLCPVLVPGDAS